MPTIDISDRLERRVAEYTPEHAANAVHIQMVQKVLENGRTTTQLISYPDDGSEPTGYVVPEAWFNVSGLQLDQIEGYLAETPEGKLLFARRRFVEAQPGTFIQSPAAGLAPEPVAVPAVEPAELGNEVAPGVFAEAGSFEERVFGDESPAESDAEPSKKRRR